MIESSNNAMENMENNAMNVNKSMQNLKKFKSFPSIKLSQQAMLAVFNCSVKVLQFAVILVVCLHYGEAFKSTNVSNTSRNTE